MVRGGLEPPTHGFSVRKRPNEIVDENKTPANRVHNRVQAAGLLSNQAALSDAVAAIQVAKFAVQKLSDSTPIDNTRTHAEFGTIEASL